MKRSTPSLRTLVRPSLLPKTAVVFASLAAAALLAGAAASSGQFAVGGVAIVAMLGPLAGLKHVEERARRLEEDRPSV